MSDPDGSQSVASPGLNLGVPGCQDAFEVGRGGFAVVYRARQPQFNRTVAIKVVSARLSSQEFNSRFDREVRAMGLLSSHPNVIVVHSSGLTAAGNPYIVMEFAAGGSLADRMLMDGPMPWQEVLAIGIKMAGALEAAHERSILHRDVKPENILVSDYGEPKLADFGISRLQGATRTATGKISGTLAYVSPEVLAGEPPSATSDVYSLGATLFVLIRGWPAFSQQKDVSVFSMVDRIRNDPVPDLRPAGVPDALCAELERAMAKQPGDRPRSAAEFGLKLRAMQAPSSLPAGPPNPDLATPGPEVTAPAQIEIHPSP